MSIGSRESLVEAARRYGLNLGNAEKDYVLSVALIGLSRLREARALVFKGGTCLRKAYFEGYRFSSDLDFAGEIGDIEGLRGAIHRAFDDITLEKVRFMKVKDMTMTGKQGMTLSLKYRSLITDRPHTNSIRLDMSFDNPPLIPPVRELITSPVEYGLEPVMIKIMPLTEMLAEKVHAIFKRPKPRDLYDMWFLLSDGTGFDRELVDRKLLALGIVFESRAFEKRLELLGRGWGRDMRDLMVSYPSFEEVRNQTLRMLAGEGSSPRWRPTGSVRAPPTPPTLPR
ncbi:MAG: nucleotidyl transferase AbiEii/AbiGii toxin family protein [Methanopyri archaeon]|jgi:predicted nucleotidyltransferase component of viral defense system|nr:nucleotidyl transferase AbiEii/AbiGii toxin family protein [Methanopyri archaeon]